MTIRLSILLAAAPLLALAACGSGGGGNSDAPAAPVAAATPPAGQEWSQVVNRSPEGGFVMGNPDAPLKLIEYGSRSCPSCGNFGRDGMVPLENDYVKTGKVSYEFRDFPVHGGPDLGLSTLGRCVSESAFFPILEQTYIDQNTFLAKLEAPEAQTLSQQLQGKSPTEIATGWATYLGYVDFVKQRGVTEQQAKACLSDQKNVQAVVDMAQKGSADGVTGTPSFLLNGKLLENTVTWEQLEARLKAAGA
ncbi:thioredoxin domain-containing protein [Hephaestia sp. GCM10023244]|uniref:thioredoxin domain-containing protein n=1 Tax=unclassified Hephaestia TaxID=2631281 RepID=UPI00207772AB|nr:thioredoxin domain-containing protein [Hephaestia sp. MAHUQ-44]MCM8729685.1 DsbA family protein [Hephaestia sp. MAHUQ-44]